MFPAGIPEKPGRMLVTFIFVNGPADYTPVVKVDDYICVIPDSGYGSF